MVRRAESILPKQLDLAKFLKRQRILALTVLSTLTAPQRVVVDKMARLRIYSNLETYKQSSDSNADFFDEILQIEDDAATKKHSRFVYKS